jgi:hypothetical protein
VFGRLANDLLRFVIAIDLDAGLGKEGVEVAVDGAGWDAGAALG